MLKLEPYFYYSKSDSEKEPIDKIIAPNEKEAIKYFISRKQIDESVFHKLYIIEHGKTESE